MTDFIGPANALTANRTGNKTTIDIKPPAKESNPVPIAASPVPTEGISPAKSPRPLKFVMSDCIGVVKAFTANKTGNRTATAANPAAIENNPVPIVVNPDPSAVSLKPFKFVISDSNGPTNAVTASKIGNRTATATKPADNESKPIPIDTSPDPIFGIVPANSLILLKLIMSDSIGPTKAVTTNKTGNKTAIATKPTANESNPFPIFVKPTPSENSVRLPKFVISDSSGPTKAVTASKTGNNTATATKPTANEK